MTVDIAASPRIFRTLLPARDLSIARQFYEELLGCEGRLVGGGRVYFDCGAVVFGVVEYSGQRDSEFPRPAEPVYFTSRHIDEIYERARKLGCLMPGHLHDDPKSPMGEIVVRPWGERSFYATDPSGNPLCFVDERTLFTGTPEQVESLRRATSENTES